MPESQTKKLHKHTRTKYESNVSKCSQTEKLTIIKKCRYLLQAIYSSLSWFIHSVHVCDTRWKYHSYFSRLSITWAYLLTFTYLVVKEQRINLYLHESVKCIIPYVISHWTSYTEIILANSHGMVLWIQEKCINLPLICWYQLRDWMLYLMAFVSILQSFLVC